MQKKLFSDFERQALKNNLFANICSAHNKLVKSDGNKTMQALPGVVIASPSTQQPDYFFHWMRDGAIVMNQVVSQYERADSKDKAALQPYLLNYIEWVRRTQHLTPLNDVDICGEPKFNVDGTLWTGQWSRPQNDGAALRALCMMRIAKALVADNDILAKELYTHEPQSMIKMDLEYIAHHWSEPTIGPWEEVLGMHFYVESVQRRALNEGAKLAKSIGDSEAADYYFAQAKQIEALMQQHWNPCMGYYHETLDQQEYRGGGITSSVIFALVYGDLPCDEKAVSSAFYVRDSMESLYQINTRVRESQSPGPLIGRYQDDMYDGDKRAYGNPWIICTAIFAHFYFRLARQLCEQNSFTMSYFYLQFFRQLHPQLPLTENALIKKDSLQFEQYINALIEAADQMLLAIKERSSIYPDKSLLHLSEQIDRCTGAATSARDLTWNYAAVLDALDERDKIITLMPNL